MLSSAASCMALQPHGNVVTRGTACPQDLGPQPPLQGPKKIKKKKWAPPLVTNVLCLAKLPSSYLQLSLSLSSNPLPFSPSCMPGYAIVP
jgi:hypothetical protein